MRASALREGSTLQDRAVCSGSPGSPGGSTKSRHSPSRPGPPSHRHRASPLRSTDVTEINRCRRAEPDALPELCVHGERAGVAIATSRLHPGDRSMGDAWARSNQATDRLKQTALCPPARRDMVGPASKFSDTATRAFITMQSANQYLRSAVARRS